jgi:hypothetical protein
MKYRRRIYYSAAQRAEIWDRWQRGESMSSIGRTFQRRRYNLSTRARGDQKLNHFLISALPSELQRRDTVAIADVRVRAAVEECL